MSAAKKKKTASRSGSGGKKSASRPASSRPSNSKKKSAPAEDPARAAQEKTFVQKYYPVFENLILFFLGMGTYWEALRAYLQEEFRYRTGQAFIGFAFFIAGCTFLVGSVSFLILALFFGLQWLTGSNFGAAFAIFLIALGLSALLFYLTAMRFLRVVEPRHQDDTEKDEWDNF